jgi:hypothetical protein
VTAALAYNPDLIVLHLGFGGRPGEQTDLTNLSMYSNQSVMLETALAAGKPLIIVMFTNLPMEITKLVADPRVSAIVQAYYPQHWGNLHALEHILFLALLPCPSHSLTSSGVNPLSHAFAHSLTHSLACSVTQTLTHVITHSFAHVQADKLSRMFLRGRTIPGAG